MIKRINNEGLTSDQTHTVRDLFLQANEDQVLLLLKALLKRVPTDKLHKLLDLVDEEYCDRGLEL